MIQQETNGSQRSYSRGFLPLWSTTHLYLIVPFLAPVMSLKHLQRLKIDAHFPADLFSVFLFLQLALKLVVVLSTFG